MLPVVVKQDYKGGSTYSRTPDAIKAANKVTKIATIFLNLDGLSAAEIISIYQQHIIFYKQDT